MRKTKLLSTAAMALLLGTGAASAQGMGKEPPERAPAAQQSAPAEKVAPSMKAGEQKSPQTTDQAAPESKAPGKGHGLTQPVDRYLGTYSNGMWGEAKLTSRDDKLVMTIGTLELRLNSAGDDRFDLQIPSSQAMPARFELDSEGRVTGFSVTIPLGKTEFHKAG